MQTRNRIAVFMSGEGSGALNLYDKSQTDEFSYEVALVLQYGKKAKTLPSRVPNQHLMDFHDDDEKFESIAESFLLSEKIDLIVLAGFTRILSPRFVEKWRGRVINIHPSLLPKYAGMLADDIHKAVIENGDKETGVTVHWADEEVDTGEILDQYRTSVLEGETVESLANFVTYMEHLVYPRVIDELLRGLKERSEKSVDTINELVYGSSHDSD